MWNFPFTPAAHAAMTPRARMHATLQGFAAPRTGVEVRGPAGNFEQLVKTVVNAPVVNDQLHPTGLFARAMPVGFDGQATKGLYARHIRSRPADSNVYPGSEIVRGASPLAGLGITSLLANQSGITPSTARAIRPTSTVLAPPSMNPGPGVSRGSAPATAEPPPVSTVAPPANVVPTPTGNGGSAVAPPSSDSPPIIADEYGPPGYPGPDAEAHLPPGMKSTGGAATGGAATMAAPTSNLSFPLMVGGAVALIGAVWYFTKD